MRSVQARRAVSDGRQQESCATDRTRLAIIALVLYHRGALLLAVSGGDKLDTMPQEGVFMERPFALGTAFSLPVRYAAVPLTRPRKSQTSLAVIVRHGDPQTCATMPSGDR
jgi:hypothetical protein